MSIYPDKFFFGQRRIYRMVKTHTNKNNEIESFLLREIWPDDMLRIKQYEERNENIFPYIKAETRMYEISKKDRTNFFNEYLKQYEEKSNDILIATNKSLETYKALKNTLAIDTPKRIVRKYKVEMPEDMEF